MYDTHRLNTIAAIINQTELQTIVCGDNDTPKLLRLVADCPTLRTIIQVQAVSADIRAQVSFAASHEIPRCAHEQQLTANLQFPGAVDVFSRHALPGWCCFRLRM